MYGCSNFATSKVENFALSLWLIKLRDNLRNEKFVSATDAYMSTYIIGEIPQSEPHVNALSNSTVCIMQWCSQTRAHTGLGPGVSNAKVLRRRVCTATRLCTVALRQYCQCAPDCSTPRSQTLSCLGTRTTLVQSRSQALVCGGECMHIVRCM